MAGYKDDLQAAHERIAALEREVARRGGAGTTAPAKDALPPAAAGGPRVAAGLVALGLGAAAVFGGMMHLVFTSDRQRNEAWLMTGLAFAAAVVGLIGLAIIGRQLLVLRPWQAAIVVGSMSRFVVGGRMLIIPFLQQARIHDLRLRCLDWSVASPLSGGAVAELRGYVLFAIAPTEHDVRRAADRFVSQGAEQIAEAVRPVVEGEVRTIVAKVTPQELNRDALGDVIRRELDEALAVMGLQTLAVGVEAHTTRGPA